MESSLKFQYGEVKNDPEKSKLRGFEDSKDFSRLKKVVFSICLEEGLHHLPHGTCFSNGCTCSPQMDVQVFNYHFTYHVSWN